MKAFENVAPHTLLQIYPKTARKRMLLTKVSFRRLKKSLSVQFETRYRYQHWRNQR